MLPPVPTCPPNRFTPSLCPCESRPFVDDPPPFLCAITHSPLLLFPVIPTGLTFYLFTCHSEWSDPVFSCARFLCAGSRREESAFLPAGAPSLYLLQGWVLR